MSVEHKRPLYAFILVAVVCGIVIGQTLRSQGLEGVMRPFARPLAMITGSSFAPAIATEPEPQASPAAAGRVGSAQGTLPGVRDIRTLSGLVKQRPGADSEAPGESSEHAWSVFCSHFPGEDETGDSADEQDREAARSRSGDQGRTRSSEMREWALHLGLSWRFDFCADLAPTTSSRSQN